jgi:hypothetical protein
VIYMWHNKDGITLPLPPPIKGGGDESSPLVGEEKGEGESKIKHQDKSGAQGY